MKILIDNGHGRETPGKRSPDGRLREYAYTREIADRVVTGLRNEGIDAIRVVPEENDVALSERVRRVNAFGKEAILISIHCNAMGSGAEWMPANGWSVFIGNNASMNSKRLVWRCWSRISFRTIRRMLNTFSRKKGSCASRIFQSSTNRHKSGPETRFHQP